MANTKPGNMYPQRYFTKRFFPGRYWTNPLYQLEQSIGTIYNKEYAFSVLIDAYKQSNILVNENLDIYLSVSKNLSALLNANHTITEDLIKNINALIKANTTILFDINKLINADINSIHPVLSELNKNTNALIASNHNITIDLLPQLFEIGITLKDFIFAIDLSLIKQTSIPKEIIFGADISCSAIKTALLDRTFNLDVSLIKNILASNNFNFELSNNLLSRNNALNNASFPVTIALDDETARNYLKTYDFPLIIDLSSDADIEYSLVDIEGVEGNFWCIIKKINTDVAVDMIQTWTEGKSINNKSFVKSISSDIDVKNINISIKKV